jgi:DNA-binding response OmpR family regulator
LNKLLLLEDDPNLAKTLIKYLKFNNYDVDWAKDGEEAIELSYQNSYLLYLFDINVPRLNGIDLLKSLRDAEDFTPTIIISAQVDIESVTKGFMAGADDYLKKPFDPEELLLRIKVKTASLQESITFKDYTLYLQSNEIFYKDEPLFLGSVQKAIFIALLKNNPNPVTYDELLNLLDKPSENALRVNIAKLKKMLNIDIKSIRGVGYKII